MAMAIAFVLASAVPLAVVYAHGSEKGEIGIRHPWSRATPPGANVAAGYMEIRNSGKTPDRLITAATPAAQRIKIHRSVREGEILKMQEVEALDIPPRQRIELRPAGSHLMIIGLKKPFAKGERIPLTLRFEKAGELQVELEVQALDSRKAHH